MPFSEQTLQEIYPEPDGWIAIIYRRPNGNDLYFGPFTSLDDARNWCQENLPGGAALIPVYKTIDWRR